MTNDISQNGDFPPLGAVLAAARQAKSLSLQAVSDTLRLSLKQIGALESDDFSALPQPMATRGFIRNYARLLELDAEPLLNSYRLRVPDNTPTSLNVQTSIPHVQLVKKNRPWLAWLLLFGLLAVLVWYYQAEPSATVPSNASAVNEVVSNVALPENPAPTAVVPPVEAGNQVYAEAQNSYSNNAEPAYAASPLPTEAAPLKDKPSVAPASTNLALQLRPSVDMARQIEAKTNALANRAVLTLTATDKAWVQVKDKSGAVVFEKMLAANSSDSFEATPPLYLWLGNANATALTYMGKPIDVASKTFNNTARLTLE